MNVGSPFDSQNSPKLKHSEFGIVGFVLSIMNGGCAILCFGIPAIIYFRDQSISQGIGLLVGLGFFADFLFSFMGLFLGLIGLVQPRRKKLLSLIGLVLNLMVTVATGSYIIPSLIENLNF